ncbi:hypothetical protein [Enterococcus sp. AZ196]|uniref:hypothetical protein n=1 Tax=Enterococcus sp. AZ196 TaxID=2774659 RepID=UPI003D2827C6
MRLLYVIKNDMHYQMRYGFYAIYMLLTFFYILILNQITDPLIKSLIGTLIVLSDPAVLGYFFIGGIWLLEKEEKLHSYMAISPLKHSDYVLGKILSLGVVSTCSSVIIMGVTMPWVNLFIAAGIIFLSSCFFTLLGLILATFAKTVNGYLMISVPPALILLAPGVLSIVGINFPFAAIIPGTIVFNLIRDTLTNNPAHVLLNIIGLFFWTCLLFMVTLRRIAHEINPSGGKRHAFNN